MRSPANYLIRRWPAAFVVAVLIVDFWRSVNAHPDQEFVTLEKLSPIHRRGVLRSSETNSGSACPDGDISADIGPLVGRSPHPSTCRFTALPCERDFVNFLRFDVLLNVIFQDCVGPSGRIAFRDRVSLYRDRSSIRNPGCISARWALSSHEMRAVCCVEPSDCPLFTLTFIV